jgi:hypothetical protein
MTKTAVEELDAVVFVKDAHFQQALVFFDGEFVRRRGDYAHAGDFRHWAALAQAYRGRGEIRPPPPHGQG